MHGRKRNFRWLVFFSSAENPLVCRPLLDGVSTLGARTRIARSVLPALAMLLATSCGGGGGGGNSTPSTPLTWDQGTWGQVTWN